MAAAIPAADVIPTHVELNVDDSDRQTKGAATDAETPSAHATAIYCHAHGRLDEAEAIGLDLLRSNPVSDQAMQILAEVCRSRGRLAESVLWLRQAVAVAPKVPEYLSELGCVFDETGSKTLAERAFREAVTVSPGFAPGHRNLAIFLTKQGRLEEALAEHTKATGVDPYLADSYRDAGELQRSLGRYDEAAMAFQAALAVNRHLMPALWGLCGVLRDQGKLCDLIEWYRRMIELDPGCAPAHSDMVFTLHYDGRATPDELFAEAVHWGRRHAAPRYAAIKPHTNDPKPDRRLRVGYISPDFRHHVVGRLIRPVLAAHDRNEVEVYCYSDARWIDAYSHELWKLSDVWRGIEGVRDEAVAERIRDDQIDILVEICGHFGNNRLAMLGYKPAPIQVSHFGYCATTGVETVDYRITDAYSDPPGESDHYHVEKLWRLPNNSWCYRPMEETPDVGPLPAISTGHVTFGCFNGLIKVTDEAVALWSVILNSLPGSRIILLSGPEDGYTLQRFAAHGIGPDRLELAKRRPRFDYMDLHNRVDLGLDPFPFNGDNTTCDALWMGVPVVSLKGKTFASRRSFSHLSNVGLGALAVETTQQYAATAIDLSSDLPRLQAIRSALRGKMLESTLCDSELFTRNLEQAYRVMWHTWCNAQTGRTPLLGEQPWRQRAAAPMA